MNYTHESQIKQNKSKMNKICRICLEEGILSSIFTKNYNLSLCEMIEYITNVKISKDDGLPEQICSNCAYKLGIAYHFKQTCESSNSRLRQYLGLEVISKTKDAEIMTYPIIMTQQTIVKKCKCMKEPKKSSSNYKKKLECEKLKRGPKPKPKKEHACYHCNKQFRCQAQLEMHVRTHTGDKPFVCMYCPRRFSQKHNLTIHLRVHTGEKPFQCDVCSKTFSAQGNLIAHLKIHTGQKDHICSICNKSFITSSELTRHMLKHRGAKNFKCDVCDAAYIHNRDLKKHKLRKHEINEHSKPQTEYNTNIDIIGIDDKKNNILPDKEDILPNNRNHLVITNPLLPYESKTKDNSTNIHQNPNNIDHEPLSCTICGEIFYYTAPLAHHYLHQHKTANI